MNFREPRPIITIPLEQNVVEEKLSREDLFNQRKKHLSRRVYLKRLLLSLSPATQEHKLSMTEIELIDQELKKIEDSLNRLQKINDPSTSSLLDSARVEEPWEVTARLKGNINGPKGRPLSPSDFSEALTGVDIKKINIDAYRTEADRGTALKIKLIEPKPII